MMKKLLLTLFFLLSFSTANASHMMGGDITYECISPGKYKLTIKVYRDCRGIPFSNPSIAAFCADGGGVNYSSNPGTNSYPAAGGSGIAIIKILP